jgi:hypothetical protein
MLKPLVNGAVSHIVECVLKNFARACNVNVRGNCFKRFLPFYKSISLVVSSSPYNWL